MTVHPKVNLRECVLMTMKPDINTKKIAEGHLEELSRTSSFLTGLLELSAKDPEPPVRLFSAAYFRRYLERFWNVEGFDKASIVKEFPYLLLSSSKEGEKQLLTTLQFILKTEEVEDWKSIITKTEEFILSTEVPKITTGLKILNKMVLAFIEEYKAEKEFESLFDNLGGPLLNIIGGAVKDRNTEVAGLAMKILGHSCESYIVPNIFKNVVFVQNLISVIEICINTLFESVSPVKWSFMVLNGILKKTKKKKDLPAFAIFERADVLTLLYRKAVDILSLYTRTGLSSKVVVQAFDLIRNIGSKSAGWELVKGDSPMLTSRFILPGVSFTEEMEDSWESSQIDFMRENEARYAKTISTVTSELFLDIAKRGKGSPELLSYLVSVIINEISGYSANAPPELVRLRYGGLMLFKIAGKYIHKNPDVFRIVLTDIKAPHPTIQYIAFSTLQHFSYFMPMPTLILEPFLAAVRSKEIAVVVESVLCLPNILTNDEMRARLKGSIPGFIKLLLELSNKIQIEALTTALEDVIIQCTEESLEIAPGIVDAICSSIVHLLKESAENEEDEPEERYEVIDGYIRTITTLIEALEKSPESVKTLMVPIKRMALEIGNSHSDFFPDLFSLIIVSSYTMKSVDGLYEILGMILKLPVDTLSIYISELSGVLDNFITYGKEQMCGFIEPILRILTEMMEGVITEYDFPYLCRILESILLNMPQALGDKLGPFINRAIRLVLSDREMLTTNSSLISAVEIVLCSVIIVPRETLGLLQEVNELGFIMGSLESTYRKFERVHDLKLLLLFTGILLSQQEKSLPAVVKVDLIMKIFVFALEGFPEALARREALKRELADEDYNADMDDSYGETECFDEDPSFETPLDAINPFDYARNICSAGPGTIIYSAWRSLSEADRHRIITLVQPKQ